METRERRQCRTHESNNTLRIYQECENGIEKPVPIITVWHHEDCQVITKGDAEGWINLICPYTNDWLFFLSTINFHILSLKKGSQKLLHIHDDITLTKQ